MAESCGLSSLVTRPLYVQVIKLLFLSVTQADRRSVSHQSNHRPSLNEPLRTNPMFTKIALSHFSMSTGDLGLIEALPHRQLRTTDVLCSAQSLFSTEDFTRSRTISSLELPRHNLRRATRLVKQLAKEQGLAYAEFGFIHGNQEIFWMLLYVAEQDCSKMAADVKLRVPSSNGVHLKEHQDILSHIFRPIEFILTAIVIFQSIF